MGSFHIIDTGEAPGSPEDAFWDATPPPEPPKDTSDPDAMVRYAWDWSRWKGVPFADVVQGVQLASSTVQWRERPANTRDFLLKPEYANRADALWPEVMLAVEQACDGGFYECVDTGSIGSGKTQHALHVQLVELHRLLCLEDPHAVFGLSKDSEIVVVFQSLNQQTAYDVDYQVFRNMVEAAPWFSGEYSPDWSVKSKLVWPDRKIVVKAVKGDAGGAIGQNVIGGIIDEINFQAIVEKSKKMPDGEVYDQAVENYNAIARRRESRFLTVGRELPGMLCLVSSKRYRGQFTDQKEEEAKTNPGIYVYDRRVWQVKPSLDHWPPDDWTTWEDKVPLAFDESDTFRVYVGTPATKPYICDPAHEIKLTDANKHLFMDIPVDFQPAFDRDLLGALRDVAGVSTSAERPFIMETEKVVQCFGRAPSIFTRPDVDWDVSKLGIDVDAIVNPKLPRWVHIDLAATRDAAGFAIGHVEKYGEIEVLAGDKPVTELLPYIHVDGIVQIRPPRGGEIKYDKIRSTIYTLSSLGLDIRWVTFDQFQSVNMKQDLARKGYQTGLMSVDKDTSNWEIAKTALYDGRVRAPKHKVCMDEWLRLEVTEKGGKTLVDHPLTGSKDCADSMACVIAGLTRRLEVWTIYGVQAREIPRSLRKGKEPNVKETPDNAKPEPGRFEDDRGRGVPIK